MPPGLDELTIEDYIAGVFGMAQRLPGTGRHPLALARGSVP